MAAGVFPYSSRSEFAKMRRVQSDVLPPGNAHEFLLEGVILMACVSACAYAVGVPIGTVRTRFLREGEDLPKEQRPVAAITAETWSPSEAVLTSTQPPGAV